MTMLVISSGPGTAGPWQSGKDVRLTLTAPWPRLTGWPTVASRPVVNAAVLGGWLRPVSGGDGHRRRGHPHRP
ncbi:hypothetical protein FrCorBMG51_06195 [Protofrankia coriariae]|uniref:Uncharacterized protein n=1 Tax=Protofrankia coriariae TaxID=1562887 RepID=A0ABR5F6B8_9ACTN|nr:hypothetical protein FrCorBMG51_06195 [Protofrankia coriariae]